MGNNNYRHNINSGFTLIEMSIVITIIALIAAGVVSGERMVQQAKLQNVIVEVQKYDTAFKAFKDKFKYYPGDLPNAASYWDATHGNAANGNGNWMYDGSEPVQAWLQLSLAGLIPETYTGTWPSGYVISVNAPKSVLTGGGYDLQSNTNASPIYGTNGNALELGRYPAGGCCINNSIFKPGDIYLIDTKIDDGVPSSGTLFGLRGTEVESNNVCVSADYQPATTATYLLNDNTASCRLWWWLDKH